VSLPLASMRLATSTHDPSQVPSRTRQISSKVCLRPPTTAPLHQTEIAPTAVRMQAHYPAGSPYRSTRHAFASVWREGGLRALYRGTDATTLRGVVLSVSQICAYDQLKQSLKRRGVMQESLALHFTASMFAGFICSVTSNPVGSSPIPGLSCD
jgi:hypothetical protein